jgi:hypothetical protein
MPLVEFVGYSGWGILIEFCALCRRLTRGGKLLQLSGNVESEDGRRGIVTVEKILSVLAIFCRSSFRSGTPT